MAEAYPADRRRIEDLGHGFAHGGKERLQTGLEQQRLLIPHQELTEREVGLRYVGRDAKDVGCDFIDRGHEPLSFPEAPRFQSSCAGTRSARLNLLEAFSQAIVAVNSTIVSSSNTRRRRANTSSGTSRPVIVIESAYSSAMRSDSLKRGLVA
jgi:hypothetical protein